MINLTGRAGCDPNIPCAKISKIRVDAQSLPASVIVPREAGLLHLECVLRTFGTANWLNFVPLNRGSFSKAVYSDQD